MASVSQIRSLFIKIQQAADESSYRKAREKANQYINSLSAEDIEKLKENDKLEVYGSGDEFKANLLEQIGAGSKSKDYKDKDKNLDESIFSKSMKEIENMDLSADAVTEAMENPDSEGAQFYQMLDSIYNDKMISGIIDSDADGKISNDEAQEFIKNLNVDKDKKNFSLNDITTFFDKMNGIVDYTKMDSKKADKLAKEKGQAGEKTGAIAKNPYVSSSKANTWSGYSSSNSAVSTPITPLEQKDDIKSQIETIKQEIQTIESNSKEQIALEKESLNEVLKNEQDENSTQVIELVDNISSKNAELASTTAQIASINADISSKTGEKASLEAALSSLVLSTDDETNSKIEQRQQELKTQIAQLEADIASLEEQKAQLETQKQTLEQEISELNSKKDELSANFSTQSKEALSNYDKNINEIQTNTDNEIQSKEAQIAKLQTELNQTEDKIQKNENTKAQSTFSADFEDMINTIIDQFEGGLSDDPDDRGGLTKFGITSATYKSYMGNKNADVSKITLEKAKEIYYNNYYLASGADKYVKEGNNAYAFALLDASINHGVPTAQKWDKQANGDVDSLMDIRKAKYESIIKNNEKQRKFKKGWENRYNGVYSYVDSTHKRENFSC